MKKALKYLESTKNETDVMDFEQFFSVDLSDAEEACRLAYNEAIDDCKAKLGSTDGHRDLRDLNKLKR